MLRTLEDDSLVRAAARSYMVELRGRIAQGQSLSVRHSQLGYTSLHAAVEFGQPLAVHELIQAGAPLDSRIAPNSRTPLHYAAQHGRVELAKDLLNAGAARSVLDSDGRRPWHYIAGIDVPNAY
jgi:cytohesin